VSRSARHGLGSSVIAKYQPAPTQLDRTTVNAIADLYRSLGLTIRTPDLMRLVRETYPNLRGRAMFDHVEAAGLIVKGEA
jgi:hypothetical protein